MDYGQPQQWFKTSEINSQWLWEVELAFERGTCGFVQRGSVARPGQRLAAYQSATYGAIQLVPRICAWPTAIARHIAADIGIGSIE